MRLRRPPQDDPRLSRGLQLLQTKITVLEDLSDRTDSQVKSLTGLLDQKNRMLQNRILEAEQQVLKIDHSMHKSMEVAEIFQDKIPHQEILERQRTVEYVKAARMANSGMSVEEIAQAVHLPREQVELIAKFNRDQLMFDESALPEWASKPAESQGTFGIADMDFVNGLEKPSPDMDNMARIDSDFKAAVKTARDAAANPPPTLLDNRVADTLKASVNSSVQHMQPAVMSMKATAQTLRDKLVSTAEDLLRSQHHAKSMASDISLTIPTDMPEMQRAITPAPATPVRTTIISANAMGTRSTTEQIKKVIFPRIEK
ncbi:MAG: DUF2802 domain-containing protein [Bdellovibrionaceae bacterium]|nr:DUF2802 domain-containing protein [Pseudobdellovibrionaceae bacterium]